MKFKKGLRWSWNISKSQAINLNKWQFLLNWKIEYSKFFMIFLFKINIFLYDFQWKNEFITLEKKEYKEKEVNIR